MKTRAIVLATLLVLTGTTTAAGQTDLPIGSGDRIRVVSANARGTFIVHEIRGDTLLLRTGRADSLLRVHVASVQRLDRSWGRDNARGMRVGLLYGAGIGAVAGVALGLASGDVPEFTAEQRAVFGAIAAGVYGAVAGAAVGYFAAPYYWVPVHLPPRVSIIPTDSRRLGVSVSFDF